MTVTQKYENVHEYIKLTFFYSWCNAWEESQQQEQQQDQQQEQQQHQLQTSIQSLVLELKRKHWCNSDCDCMSGTNSRFKQRAQWCQHGSNFLFPPARLHSSQAGSGFALSCKDDVGVLFCMKDVWICAAAHRLLLSFYWASHLTTCVSLCVIEVSSTLSFLATHIIKVNLFRLMIPENKEYESVSEMTACCTANRWLSVLQNFGLLGSIFYVCQKKNLYDPQD